MGLLATLAVKSVAEVVEREKESVREVKDRLHDLRAAELSRIQEVTRGKTFSIWLALVDSFVVRR